jgi:hypothetical protein
MLPCIAIDIFSNNQPGAPTIQILFCYKNPHASGIPAANRQESPTVHSALVSFMQVSNDRFQAESGWNRWNSPKHVEFYNRIKLG